MIEIQVYCPRCGSEKVHIGPVVDDVVRVSIDDLPVKRPVDETLLLRKTTHVAVCNNCGYSKSWSEY